MICAVCTDEIVGDAFSREPLGKNDAMVVVCPGCSSGPIRAARPVDRGYEPSGGTPTAKESAQVKVPRAPNRPYVSAFTRRAGTRLVRLPLRRDETARSAAEAVAADIPTLAEDLRYLGTANSWHLFETELDDATVRAHRQRVVRERNADAGNCINSASHGPATDGVLCALCRSIHRRSA